MGDDVQHEALNGMAPWMRFWFDMASGAMEACQAWAGPTASPDAMRRARSDLLNVWSDAWEKQLRSSLFTSTAKQVLSGTAELRNMVHEVFDQVHREFRLAGRRDVDQLTVAVRRLEQRLLDEFEEVSTRLDALSDRLEAIQSRLDLEAAPAGSENGTPELNGHAGDDEKRKHKKREKQITP